MASVTVDVELDEFHEAEMIEYLLDSGYLVSVPEAKLKALREYDRKKIERTKVLTVSAPPDDAQLAELRECIIQRRMGDALALIDRMAAPKFRTVNDCMERYTKAVTPAVAAE